VGQPVDRTPDRPEQYRESTSQRRKDGADSSGKRTSFGGSRGIANTASGSGWQFVNSIRDLVVMLVGDSCFRFQLFGVRQDCIIKSMKKLTSLFITYCLCGSVLAFASDEASLNQAIQALNARAKTDADKKLVLKAVSQQTRLPEKTLRSQMSATHLSYGELLAANTIAEGSGKNLNAVLTTKGGKSWASVSKQFRVDPSSIVDRLQIAEMTAQAGRVGSRAQNTQGAQRGRRGSDYGPQAGGPMGVGTSNRGPR
jgi:hypothetical protein